MCREKVPGLAKNPNRMKYNVENTIFTNSGMDIVFECVLRGLNGISEIFYTDIKISNH